MTQSIIKQVLEEAIWAPSGDNRQNWRFKIQGEDACEILIKDDSDWMVYDKQGHATLIALGCLLEYITISASNLGYRVEENILTLNSEQLSRCQIRLIKADLPKDDLFEQLKKRTVQRKPMDDTPLTAQEKNDLESELKTGFKIKWLETSSEKKEVARLLFGNAKTRYAMKEGFDVHSKIIDFRKKYFYFSPTKLPAMSLGVSLPWVWMTQLSLSNWKVFHFVEKYLAGTLIPRYLMEYKTAIHSSAHFILLRDEPVQDSIGYIESGRSLIRFWLKCSALGLGFQPEHTPIIFSELIRNKVKFTEDSRANENALEMDKWLKRFLGEDAVKRAVYMGRIGRSDLPTSRSVRRPLEELIISDSPPYK